LEYVGREASSSPTRAAGLWLPHRLSSIEISHPTQYQFQISMSQKGYENLAFQKKVLDFVFKVSSGLK
jgi:hypothetical protein